MSAYAWPAVVLVLGLAALRMAWLLLDQRRQMHDATERWSKELGEYRNAALALSGSLDTKADASDLTLLAIRLDTMELKAGLEREGL